MSATDPNVVRGRVTLDALENSTRQPVIPWTEADNLRIHKHLAFYALSRHNCNKSHFEELARNLGLIRSYRFSSLVQTPLRNKIKREFEKLLKEGHVTEEAGPCGVRFVWGDHTKAWAREGWLGDRDARDDLANNHDDENNNDNIGNNNRDRGDGIRPEDSASVIAQRQSPRSAPAVVEPAHPHAQLELSSLGTATHEEFDRLEDSSVVRGFRGLGQHVNAQARRENPRPPPPPQQQQQQRQRLQPGLSPPLVAVEARRQQSPPPQPPPPPPPPPPRPVSPPPRHQPVRCPAPVEPPEPAADEHERAPPQAPARPSPSPPHHPVQPAPVQATVAASAEVTELFHKQALLMRDMVTTAMSISALKFDIATERFSKPRRHTSEERQVQLSSATLRYKTVLARVRGIEKRLVEIDAVLELPCGAPMVLQQLNKIVFSGLM